MKLIGIKTKKEIFVAGEKEGSYSRPTLSAYFFDGKKPQDTFKEGWYLIDKPPVLIEKEVKQPDINHRYELQDESFKSDKVPLVFKREDVAEYNKTEYYWVWKDEYKHLESLYELKSDPQPPIRESMEFEFKMILELDEIREWNGFAYPVQKSQWAHEGLRDLTEKEVKYQGLDQIIFPDIVLPGRPCKLTSTQVYNIVREHIKNKINPVYAEITSDYDFCFTVKKKIKHVEPEEFMVNVNFMTKKKPKLEKRSRRYRLIEVFEMTPAEKGYKEYTPIDGITGDNIEDLKKKVDAKCEELIKEINQPVVDCKHCKGLGIEWEKEIKGGSEE